jgi:hypothetical protein
VIRAPFLITVILLFPFFNLFAQDEDVDKYFDDGGASTASNVIKFNLTSPFIKEYSVGFEKCFGDRFGILAEVGVVRGFATYTPYSVSEKYYLPDATISYRIEPRVYVFGSDAPMGLYTSVAYRFRTYNLKDYYTQHQNRDYLFSSGFQFELKNRVVMDISAGFVITKVDIQLSTGDHNEFVDGSGNITARVGYKF